MDTIPSLSHMHANRLHTGLVVAMNLLALPAVLAQDTTPPELGSISMIPSSVQVDAAAATVDVTITVTDVGTGFDFGNLILYRPGDVFVNSIFFNVDERTAGDEFDGTYEIPVTVPQYSQPGTWKIGVLLLDNDSNRREYGPGDDPFPVPGDEEFTVANPGTVDTAIPEIANLSIVPASVDTGSAQQTITLTFEVSDPLSGFNYGFVNVYDPGFDYNSTLSPYFDSSERIAGDGKNGTYEVSLTLPQGSQAGDWTFDIYVRDQAGNSGFPSGGTGGFAVSNTGAASGDLSDATDATQFVWSTSGDADWFFQTGATLDGVDAAQSGSPGPNGSSVMDLEVTGPGSLTFWWKVESEESSDELSVEVLGTPQFEVISGDVDWVDVSLGIPAGTHTVRWTYAKDSGFDFGADAGWVDRVHFMADSDGEEPVLQGIRIAPKTLDITAGDQFYTLTLEVSDDFNGVDSGTVWIYDENGDLYDQIDFDSANRVSGDESFGTYELDGFLFADDIFPIGFYSWGIWYVEVEVNEIGTGNSRYYSGFDEPFPNPGDETFVVGDGSGGGGGPPVLELVGGFAPDPADVSAGGVPVTVTFDVSDDDVGLDYGVVYLNNPNGDYVTGIFFDQSDLVAGDEFYGTYLVTLPVPEFALPGDWSVDFYLQDLDGNETDDSVAGQFTVVNTGTADTGSPALNSFSLSPTAVDPASSPASVSVSFNATDDLSGLQQIFLFLYNPANNFQFTVSVDPASGSGGDFSTTIELPAGSAAGTWKVVTFLRDKVGNVGRYGLFGDPYPTPGSEEITVGPVTGSTFAGFIASYGLNGADALPGGNPDGDPFPNWIELVLGLDPTVPDVINPSAYAIEQSGGELRIVFTIDPALTIQTSGEHLELAAGSAGPFLLTGQSSPDLAGSWTDQLPVWVSGTTYRVSLDITPGSTGFLRLNGNDP